MPLRWGRACSVRSGLTPYLAGSVGATARTRHVAWAMHHDEMLPRVCTVVGECAVTAFSVEEGVRVQHHGGAERLHGNPYLEIGYITPPGPSRHHGLDRTTTTAVCIIVTARTSGHDWRFERAS